MQYLDGFSGSSPIEAVAVGHHRRAEEMLGDLGVPVAQADGEGSLPVEGTDLDVAWETRPMDGAGTLFVARMRAMVESGSVNLLAFSVVKPDIGTPVRVVEGFRGHGDDLLGDFRIGTLRTGLVEYGLGSLGVNGQPVDEPFGTTKHRLHRMLTNLDEVELRRLQIVDRGIRDGFDAAEMIRGGEPAADVLAMMDRQPSL